jgi:agmatinase
MTREEKIAAFDVNGISVSKQVFGLPFTEEESHIILIPVPWEVTVSYGKGTVDGPKALLEASWQVDLFNMERPDFWQKGMYMIEEPVHLRRLSDQLRPLAEKRIDALSAGEDPSYEDLQAIEAGCKEMINWVEKTATHYLELGKKIILTGGDHSTPLGMIKALGKKYDTFGVLQIDAHADLREAYEGFTYSHASITYNILKESCIEKVVQVGIRDFCHAEYALAERDERVDIFYDKDLQRALFEGQKWSSLCDKIIRALPQKIYITFDVDGLDPRFCPNTGTPVFGGLTPDQVLYLVSGIIESGRKVIGFDINEIGVGNDDWDANVAARLLYNLATLVC